jgi:hypothetical protein
MMTIVTILIYAVSLDLQLPSCVTISNQCLNTKLVSPVYFGNGAVCPKLSGQQIDIGTKMGVCFEISATQDDFEGVLLYKMQIYSDSQRNMDTLSIRTNKNKAMHFHMLAIWKVKDSRPFVYVVLVEHTNEFTWDEGALKKLYYENHGCLKEYNGIVSDTWAMDDNIILRTSFIIRSFERNFELSISISEEEEDEYAIIPLLVNLER